MILKNIAIEIVYDTIAYDAIMKEVLRFRDPDFFSLIHFKQEEGYMYIPKINDMICSGDAPKYLWHPSVKIFYEEKQLDVMDELSLLVNINIKRLDTSENFKIVLYGDMKYCDAMDRNRKFCL